MHACLRVIPMRRSSAITNIVGKVRLAKDSTAQWLPAGRRSRVQMQTQAIPSGLPRP